ncbi:MAG: hypothetical protein FWF05_08265 [Oscillospiraceae bacterium]|nr:hypothetical protein [Oscillospiraceae bacterium]
MKRKLFMILAAAVLVVSTLSLTAFGADRLDIRTYNQVDSVDARTYTINDNTFPSLLTYVVAEPVSPITVGATSYQFIIWTERALDETQKDELVSYIRARATGSLATVTRASANFYSGDPATIALGVMGINLTLTRTNLVIPAMRLLSRFGYGLFRVIQSGEGVTNPNVPKTGSSNETLASVATICLAAATAYVILSRSGKKAASK